MTLSEVLDLVECIISKDFVLLSTFVLANIAIANGRDPNVPPSGFSLTRQVGIHSVFGFVSAS